MSIQYLQFYKSIKRSFYYYHEYRQRSLMWDNFIKMILATVSSASIASLFIWQDLPFVWAGIIASTEILKVIQTYLPFQKRIISLDFFLPELNFLLIEIEEKLFYAFDKSDEKEQLLSDSELNKLINDFNKKYSDLENKFSNSSNFGFSKHCSKIADKHLEGHLCANYPSLNSLSQN